MLATRTLLVLVSVAVAMAAPSGCPDKCPTPVCPSPPSQDCLGDAVKDECGCMLCRSYDGCPGEATTDVPSTKDANDREGCKIWYDGCNFCLKRFTGDFCTHRQCVQRGKAYCALLEVQDKCKVWFDGCNTCTKDERSGFFTQCTDSVCETRSEPKCVQKEEEEPCLPECPVPEWCPPRPSLSCEMFPATADSCGCLACPTYICPSDISPPSCGPSCDTKCRYGNILDERGCPLCLCHPGPDDSSDGGSSPRASPGSPYPTRAEAWATRNPNWNPGWNPDDVVPEWERDPGYDGNSWSSGMGPNEEGSGTGSGSGSGTGSGVTGAAGAGIKVVRGAAVGVIVGAVIGSLLLLALVAAVVIFAMRRSPPTVHVETSQGEMFSNPSYVANPTVVQAPQYETVGGPAQSSA